MALSTASFNTFHQFSVCGKTWKDYRIITIWISDKIYIPQMSILKIQYYYSTKHSKLWGVKVKEPIFMIYFGMYEH